MKKKKIQNYIIQLSKELGEGSFGKVYLANREPTKEAVAIKVLMKEAINSDDYVKEALVSEVKVMRMLNSRWIVALKDVLETANNYYIVQEYCDGGTLRNYMVKNKQIPEKQAVAILTQICEGFLELIKNGIIHRDVKPENILINNEDFKIADFGFAKNVGSIGQLNKSLVGTPLYMAPQLLRMEKYSTKCDIWAIGLIFYEMLLGEVPWPARSEFQLISLIETRPLLFPRKPEISANARNFIEGCLKIKEVSRFGWKQLYSHPIFDGKFREYTDITEKLERKAGFIINELRIKIHYQNIDMEKLFTKMNFNRHSSLNLDDLLKLLKTLDNDIEREEAQYIFELLDIDKNGSIEFEELKNCLSRNGIRMEPYVPCLKPNNTSFVEGEQTVSVENKKIKQAIMKLRKKLDQFNLDLHIVYSIYDKNNDRALSAEQFKHLLHRIDKSLTDDECSICFKIFDTNGDQKISYDEFFRTICKIAGEPYSKY